MSSGAFTISRYESAEGPIHPIRLQPETLLLVLGGASNDPPVNPVDNEISCYARKPKERYGIGARGVRLAWETPATPPTGYKPFETLVAPILTPALFAAAVVGTTGTYLGANVVVVSKLPEDIK